MNPVIIFGLSLGLSIGAPILRANDAYESPYDPYRTNVFYDLAVLYGDKNGDDAVSDDELKSFDISDLEPSGKPGESQTFRFLGFYLPTMEDVIFYTWSSSRIDDSPLEADGTYDYDANGYSYVLNYRNSSEADEDSSTGWASDYSRTATPLFCNFYRSEKGYFSKFVIHGYQGMETDGLYRIKATSLSVFDPDGSLSADYQCGDGAELLYNSDIVGENPVFQYYEENTYEIRGVVDLLLYSTMTEGWHWGIGPTFTPTVQSGGDVKEAREMFYVFFDFSDDFMPDEIRSVTYSAVSFAYTQTHYFGRGGESGEIYSGDYDDAQDSVNLGGSRYTDSVAEVSGSRKQVVKTVTDELVTMKSRVYNSVLGSYVTETEGQVKGIVPLDDVDTDFSGDDYSMFREFLKADDHLDYSWAYAIQDDSWVRTVADAETVGSYSDPHYEGGMFLPTSFVQRETTACHGLESVVTLGMRVVQEGKEFDIKCMNNPLTTRNVYLVGSPVPSLGDVVVGSVDQFLSQWWWVVLLVVLFVIGILAMLVRPVLDVLKAIGKGLLLVVKIAIDIVYIVLVWWWLAIVKKAQREGLPPLWIFGK